MHPQAIKIINSCTTHLQLDTCNEWVNHIYTGDRLTEAKSIIRAKRNEIDRVLSKFTPEHIAEIQKQEH